MKRIYISPEIKIICLHLPVMLEGSVTSPGKTQVDGNDTGPGDVDPEGTNGSRWIRQGMWDDVE